MPKPVASFSAKAATGVIFGGCQADFGVEKIDYIIYIDKCAKIGKNVLRTDYYRPAVAGLFSRPVEFGFGL